MAVSPFFKRIRDKCFSMAFGDKFKTSFSAVILTLDTSWRWCVSRSVQTSREMGLPDLEQSITTLKTFGCCLVILPSRPSSKAMGLHFYVVISATLVVLHHQLLPVLTMSPAQLSIAFKAMILCALFYLGRLHHALFFIRVFNFWLFDYIYI